MVRPEIVQSSQVDGGDQARADIFDYIGAVSV